MARTPAGRHALNGNSGAPPLNLGRRGYRLRSAQKKGAAVSRFRSLKQISRNQFSKAEARCSASAERRRTPGGNAARTRSHRRVPTTEGGATHCRWRSAFALQPRRVADAKKKHARRGLSPTSNEASDRLPGNRTPLSFWTGSLPGAEYSPLSTTAGIESHDPFSTHLSQISDAGICEKVIAGKASDQPTSPARSNPTLVGCQGTPVFEHELSIHHTPEGRRFRRIYLRSLHFACSPHAAR